MAQLSSAPNKIFSPFITGTRKDRSDVKQSSVYHDRPSRHHQGSFNAFKTFIHDGVELSKINKIKYLKYLKASPLYSMFLVFCCPWIVCFTETNLQLASWIGSEIGLTAPSQVDQSRREKLKYYLWLLQALGASAVDVDMDSLDTTKLKDNTKIKRRMLSGGTWGKRIGDQKLMKFLRRPSPQ